MTKKKELSFEDAIKRLEEIVDLLNSGNCPLDDALSLFCEGSKLVNFCKEKLDNVEKSVVKLVEENGEFIEKKFSPDGESDD